MIKLIIGAVILLGFVYMGMGMERYYKERAALLADIKKYLEDAARDVAFNKTDFLTLTERHSGSRVLDKIISALRCKIVGYKAKDEPVSPYLTKSENKALSEFFTGLAVSDFESQKELFKKYESEFERAWIVAEKEKVTKGKLQAKLLCLGGIVLLILII